MLISNKKYIIYLYCFVVSLIMIGGCSNDIEDVTVKKTVGEPAVVYARIGKGETVDTRAVANSYDQWTTNSFNLNDKMGMYALKGLQSEDDPNNYTLPIKNGIMYFDGYSGTSFRFSNPEMTIDPVTVNGSYSIMYYPYYADMPPTYPNTTTIKGMPMRIKDTTDDIEKCVDLMQTYLYYSSSGSSYTSYYIPITNGVLQPTFNHHFSELIIQRGEGFTNAPDPRIWVVMQNPYTDLRVVQSSSTGSFTVQLQNNPDPDENLEVTLVEGKTATKVDNKYRVWQAWQGAPYSNGIGSYYVVIPPSTVSYIIMQDDYGTWQRVGDFYLDNYNYASKIARGNVRYQVTVVLSGLNATVKPVLIEDWDDTVIATDDRDVGIEGFRDFERWLSIYNLYTENEGAPDESLVESLKEFGDSEKDVATGTYSWTFYINSNLDLPNGVNYQINILKDRLVGTSSYANYTISNLTRTFIKEMKGNGSLENLDFNDLYITDIGDGTESGLYAGGLVNIMSQGTIDNCKINNGIVVSDKAAGIIAGSVINATISKCKITGQVVGTSTDMEHEGVFGETPQGRLEYSNNTTTGLYFENYN